MNSIIGEHRTATVVTDVPSGAAPGEDLDVGSRSVPAKEPRGYRVHTNTWTAYDTPLDVDDVFSVLDGVDAHFEAAKQSLQPAVTDQTVTG